MLNVHWRSSLISNTHSCFSTDDISCRYLNIVDNSTDRSDGAAGQERRGKNPQKEIHSTYNIIILLKKEQNICV